MADLDLKIVNFIEKVARTLHTNSEEVISRLRKYKYFREFEERDDDVYIATYLKSGTTWMQMILFQMLHEGGDSFGHIYDVSPWPGNESVSGKSAQRVNQLPSPRILKTHNIYSDFRKDVKGKFIYIFRNGIDVAASVYHHDKNYVDPDLTFNMSFRKYFENEEENWFLFNQAWLENSNRFTILYLSYERLKVDFAGCINEIALFLGITLNEEIRGRINTYATFQHMKKIEHKFGVKPIKESRLVYNQFIRKGIVGDGDSYLTDEQKELYHQRYNKILSKLVQQKL
jgi:hypothetical protein